MKKIVYKYPLPDEHNKEFLLNLSKDTELLQVESKFEKPYLYTLENFESKDKESRTFIFAETGKEFGKEGAIFQTTDRRMFYVKYIYIGTAKLHGDTEFYHLFEVLYEEIPNMGTAALGEHKLTLISTEVHPDGRVSTKYGFSN